MKVAFTVCNDYRADSVRQALDRLCGYIGLAPEEIFAGRRVLIKPNLLTDKSPDNAATTHPEVVRAVIGMIRRGGGIPTVGDSAASPMKMDAVWERTGFAAMCAGERVPLISLEQAGARRFEYQGMAFSIARPVLEADLIVNVPKLKTHLLTVVTNAVKNMYGVLPGLQKTALHKRFPSPGLLGGFLAYLYSLLRPGLTICDAVLAMDGNGPASGRPVHLGRLAASFDGLALDLAVCRRLRVPLAQVPYFVPPLVDKGAEAFAAGIEYAGDGLQGFPGQEFVLPVALVRRLIPVGLVRLLRPLVWSRPVFDAACVRCGRCVQACPVTALHLPAAGGPPRLDPAECIECGCCSEVCPADAVDIRRSRLLRCGARIREWQRRFSLLLKNQNQ